MKSSLFKAAIVSAVWVSLMFIYNAIMAAQIESWTASNFSMGFFPRLLVNIHYLLIGNRIFITLSIVILTYGVIMIKSGGANKEELSLKSQQEKSSKNLKHRWLESAIYLVILLFLPVGLSTLPASVQSFISWLPLILLVMFVYSFSSAIYFSFKKIK